MNPVKNEMNIKLGEVEILLRPSFENLVELEEHVGAVAFLGWRFASVAGLKDGKFKPKDCPKLTEAAQIIYYCQAARDPNDETKRKHSLEEIWALCGHEGAFKIMSIIALFLTRVGAGAKNKPVEESVAEEKKS